MEIAWFIILVTSKTCSAPWACKYEYFVKKDWMKQQKLKFGSNCIGTKSQGLLSAL